MQLTYGFSDRILEGYPTIHRLSPPQGRYAPMSVENRSYPGVHSADTALDINPRRLFNVFRHGAQIEIFLCSLIILHAV